MAGPVSEASTAAPDVIVKLNVAFGTFALASITKYLLNVNVKLSVGATLSPNAGTAVPRHSEKATAIVVKTAKKRVDILSFMFLFLSYSKPHALHQSTSRQAYIPRLRRMEITFPSRSAISTGPYTRLSVPCVLKSHSRKTEPSDTLQGRSMPPSAGSVG